MKRASIKRYPGSHNVRYSPLCDPHRKGTRGNRESLILCGDVVTRANQPRNNNTQHYRQYSSSIPSDAETQTTLTKQTSCPSTAATTGNINPQKNDTKISNPPPPPGAVHPTKQTNHTLVFHVPRLLCYQFMFSTNTISKKQHALSTATHSKMK